MLKTATLFELENGYNAVQVYGTHATTLGTVFSPNQIVEAIDAITPANVNEVSLLLFLLLLFKTIYLRPPKN